MRRPLRSCARNATWALGLGARAGTIQLPDCADLFYEQNYLPALAVGHPSLAIQKYRSSCETGIEGLTMSAELPGEHDGTASLLCRRFHYSHSIQFCTTRYCSANRASKLVMATTPSPSSLDACLLRSNTNTPPPRPHPPDTRLHTAQPTQPLISQSARLPAQSPTAAAVPRLVDYP